ncbi:hypothetical protein Skr01_42290 [Sphaerisporangium krabiense]|uniref:Uncharacterized protein n=1 Tax=Sphaerisporangium krabiense TaxID=763782 RepID=A0A7W9DNE5_9ACTN|nr:hypothetical protein [Sphaerisporangium krabiense]MBB5625341.1 hypothetical protein [Sphaerisporangium krabiense]GII64144.1 hypothetical protein Skr01_42290 [Sphaerisporangium krabiense]
MADVSKEPFLRSRPGRFALAVVSAVGLVAEAGCAISVAEASGAATPKITSVPVPVSVSAPRIVANGGAGGSSSGDGKGGGDLDLTIGITNEGKEAVTIVGFGRSGPGMKLLLPARRGPYVLLPGEEMGLQVKYRVTDCKAVPRTEWPIPVRVLRSGGEQAVYLKSSGETPWHWQYIGFCKRPK